MFNESFSCATCWSNAFIFSDSGVATPPTATATIAGAQDNVAGITGNIASGGLSNDATPTLSGAIVGTMVSSEVLAIYDGATKLGLATVTGSSWSYTPAALGAGAHSFTAVAESALGNQGTTSAAYSLNLDLTSPAAPVISAVATDNIINAAEQTAAISGTAEANATVALSVGGNTRTVTANSSGVWSYTLVAADITAMGQGNETLSATATDAAGNTSAAGTRAISVDTAAPTLTTAVVDSATLTLTFSEAIDGAHLPAAFPVVLVNGVADLVTDASIAGSAVILTLTSAVHYNDVVTVSYTDPSSGNDVQALQDLAGNDVANVSNWLVGNLTPSAQLSPLEIRFVSISGATATYEVDLKAGYSADDGQIVLSLSSANGTFAMGASGAGVTAVPNPTTNSVEVGFFAYQRLAVCRRPSFLILASPP